VDLSSQVRPGKAGGDEKGELLGLALDTSPSGLFVFWLHGLKIRKTKPAR
jgi:hypothetical protein